MFRRTHFLIAALLAVVALCLSCVDIPTNPVDDPLNASVRLFVKDGSDPIVPRGTVKEIGLEVVLTRHLSSVTISSTCGSLDTTLIVDSLTIDTTKLSELFYFNPLFSNEGKCVIIAHASMVNSELKDRADTLTIHVLPEQAGISFIALPQNRTLLSGTSDTMLFVTRVTGGAAVPASYALSITPQDAQELFTIEYSAARDTVKVLSALQSDGVYTITLVAVSTYGDSALADTASCVLTVEETIAPSIVHAPEQVIAGTADTLMFTIDNSGRSMPLTISLITDTPFDSAVFTIVPTGPDSIVVAIAAGATAGEATFGVITSNGTTSDTGWYPVTIISPEAALWSTTTARVDAVEGETLAVDLAQYIAPAHAALISVTSSVGTVSGSTWSFTPQWGCAEEIPVTFTAKKGEVSLNLQMVLVVAGGDTEKPELALVDAALDGKVTGSSQITVECRVVDRGAGIASVDMTFGGTTVAGTLQSNGIYRGVITGLLQGVPAKVTITATDRSREKNSQSLVFTVTYDSTMLDSEGPVLQQVAGPQSGTRVKNATGKMSFSVSDDSGIDSIWWTLGEVFAGELLHVDGVYTLSYVLPVYGESVVAVHAKDASPNHTGAVLKITLHHNTVPALALITSPAHRASGVETTPTFAWSSGDDADGDQVFYRVLYKKSSESNYTTSGEITGKSYPLPEAAKLPPFTTYVWKVVAYTKTYTDTVVSTEGEFTTFDPTVADVKGPSITRSAGPESGSRVTTASGSISCTVTDQSGVDSVWWTLNGGFAGVLTSQSGVYTLSYTQLKAGSNVIAVFARDKATARNRDSLSLALVYNSLPAPAVVQTVVPKAGDADVAVTPQFVWKRVNDPDGDTLYYSVLYGVSSVNLALKLPETRDTTFAVAAAQKLDMVKTYFWQVVAYTKKPFEDTVRSEVVSFTTAGAGAVVTVQPVAPAALYTGETLTLKVVATGTPVPSYQWYKDAQLLNGQQSDTYIKTGVTTADNGVYYVTVKNSAGPEERSSTVTIMVKTKATVVTGPVAQTVNEGSPANFTVAATGDPVLMYQWQKNRVNVAAGGTNTTCSIAAAVPGDTGNYRCIVKNSFSSDTSAEAHLSVTATPVYTVKFDTDGGSVVDSQRVRQGLAATEPTVIPTKSNYEFGGWYPSRTSGTEYDFSTAIIAAKTIYAKWTPVYTVTYDANGGAGSVPVDATKYKSGNSVTVKSGSGLSRTDYTFDKWNTESNGSGTSYSSGATFSIGSESVRLYALWKKNTCTVHFDGQEATTAPSPASKTVEVGSAVGSLPAEPGKTGYLFKGWYTGANGSGTPFTGTSTVSSTVTVYAKWVIMDADGNTYTEVKIGTQVWMVENLKTTKYNDGLPIANVTDSGAWTILSTPAYCWYENESVNKNVYGALYNWFVVNTKKLAPLGWRVATHDDWEILYAYLGGNSDVGGTLKEVGTSHWLSPNEGATNSTGFTGIPGGWRHYTAIFSYQGEEGDWWTSSEYNTWNAYAMSLRYASTTVGNSWLDKKYGLSVRCIRDY